MPRQLLRELTPADVNELLAYERLHPRGEERADLRMARICATIVNSDPWRGSAPPIPESDFLPDFGREQRQQSVAEMKAIAQRMAHTGEAE